MPDLLDSVYERRTKTYDAVGSGWIDHRVLDLLITAGVGTDDEAPLWDYKLELPVMSPRQKDTAEYQAKMAGIVKDAVAFYNSYGGYLVAGVDDTTRKVVGFNRQFDASDLNRKIYAATGVSIETVYRQIEIADAGARKDVGLIFIPRREENKNPAQFKKDAPKHNGRAAYAASTFYLRDRDSCRAATSPEDFEFLYGPRNLVYTIGHGRLLENNLPSRDQDFTRLIGREDELSTLWRWLSDSFSPVKILSGLGGVGKTSIAYTFAERLISRAPANVDRLVWLGAKAETFSGELDKLVPLPRTDFSDVEGLFRQILLETGCPPEQLPDMNSRDEVLGACQEHLASYSYLLVVDNVDTLADEDQQSVFHLLTQLCSLSRNKCLITARRNLGAPRSVFTDVKGLSLKDFEKFVLEKCNLMQIEALNAGSTEMSAFHEASGGSPLFGLSVLRLVALGDSFKDAILHWGGSDGEAVRTAAFAREIGRLKGNEARVLLVLCYLRTASSIALAHILNLSRFDVQRALEELQAFSMTSIDTSLPGGALFRISPSLPLVTTLVEQRVPDYLTIKTACKRAIDISRDKKPFIAEAVVRTLALLGEGEPTEAVAVVKAAIGTLPDNPDLLCLLGRCHHACGQWQQADEAYQRAYDLGCRKRELFYGWVELFESQENWTAVIDKSTLGEEVISSCRLRLARNNSRAQLGNERCRSGNYQIAASLYEEAINDIKDGLNKYTLAGDRAELWRQNDLLAISWIGVIRQQAAQAGDDGRRVFGAYYKAIMGFRLHRRAALLSAISVLSDWLNRVSGRKVLSPTAREHLELTLTRLQAMRSSIGSRVGVSESDRLVFDDAAERVQEKLIALLDN